MRSTLLALSLAIGCHLGLCPQAFSQSPMSIDDRATHQQVGVIEILADHPMQINAFCLNAQGQIVAACGDGPGEIRVTDDRGKVLRSWRIEVKPEAVSVAPDGSVLVGGEGKLFRFDSQGKQLSVSESPHAERLRQGSESLRKAAVEYLSRRRDPIGSRIAMYTSVIEQLEARAAKGNLNKAEERMLETLPRTLERYQQQLAARGGEGDDSSDGPSEAAIQERMQYLIRSKMRISSITSSDDHVFVATRGLEGYGYDVWKMNQDFGQAQVIVTGLRGCCGQMDVQCCPQGLFVAENSRDRVVRFDTEGNEIINWGKSDRTGIDGFTSCCNPMNVCFDKDGYVYTAEASVGRIKRFNSEGKLVDFIGDVDLVPGCKNVSIAVSPVNDNIYMLDLTRNHIKLMQPKPAGAKQKRDGGNEPIDKRSVERAKTQQRSLAGGLLSLLGIGGGSNE